MYNFSIKHPYRGRLLEELMHAYLFLFFHTTISNYHTTSSNYLGNINTGERFIRQTEPKLLLIPYSKY